MTLSIAVGIQFPQVTDRLWRVVEDGECPDWGFRSRTLTMTLSQAPAVYRYSRTPEYSPGDYRVDEEGLREDYYRINNYDGRGRERCNYLFGSASALYNAPDPDGVGFPKRAYLTMSNNLLKEIEWVTVGTKRYLKFETVRPGQDVSYMTPGNNPDKVHRFNVVQFRDNQTVTTPVVNRGGYVYYFLTSAEGFGYIPERFVKAV